MALDADYLAFRERMVARMRDLGINQLTLARESGVAQGQISRWLHGTWPAARHLPALAAALGWTVDFLLTGTDPRSAVPLTREDIAHAAALIQTPPGPVPTTRSGSTAPAAARRTKG